MTKIEFYEYDTAKCIQVGLEAGGPPPKGALISIRGVTWRVACVTWTVDRPNGKTPRLRANVSPKRRKP